MLDWFSDPEAEAAWRQSQLEALERMQAHSSKNKPPAEEDKGERRKWIMQYMEEGSESEEEGEQVGHQPGSGQVKYSAVSWHFWHFIILVHGLVVTVCHSAYKGSPVFRSDKVWRLCPQSCTCIRILRCATKFQIPHPPDLAASLL